MSERASTSVAIIGGGATGVILAAHLVRAGQGSLRVTIVERGDAIGSGLAYSTNLPDHRLNVRADLMGALAGEPGGFWTWVKRQGLVGHDDSRAFLPRELYGRYLSALFRDLSSRGSGLRAVHDECVDVTPTPSGVEVRLASGISLPAHMAVLAIGHDPNPAPEQSYGVRMGSPQDTPLDPEARVVILGSGLSMVDAWLTLESRGHRGEVVAISRRGLLPLSHVSRPSPLRLDSADIPLGTELSYFVQWFGELVREVETKGGDWRDVVDGLRPFNQRIWREWPLSARRRFMEHTKAWWDIHRHRLAPDIRARAEAAIAAGRLRLMAAKIVEASAGANGTVTLTVRPRNRGDLETIEAARIYDCTGLAKDIIRSSHALLQRLFAKGTIRPDPLHLGLDVTVDCAVLDRNGEASTRLFAVGPLTRGAFFEIDAVPEIREQSARLAARIAEQTPVKRSA